MKRGFTLIELLVVIAIIGLLSSIVLASLSSARDRAKDAKIKSMMGQMKAQAELFRLDVGSYRGSDSDGIEEQSVGGCLQGVSDRSTGSLFDPNLDNNVTLLGEEIYSLSSGSEVRVLCATANSSNDDSWAFAVPLLSPAPSNTGWCVDSSGNAKDVGLEFTNAGGAYNLRVGGFADCP